MGAWEGGRQVWEEEERCGYEREKGEKHERRGRSMVGGKYKRHKERIREDY